jgi:hypothetical protein
MADPEDTRAGGAPLHSPALQRWETVAHASQVPEGRRPPNPSGRITGLAEITRAYG